MLGHNFVNKINNLYRKRGFCPIVLGVVCQSNKIAL